MKLLHVDSSITGDQSVSRQLSKSIVASLVHHHPSISVTRRDLAASPLSHLELAALGSEGEEATATAAVLDEFLVSDIVVVGAPLYNFTIPSQLKAWIDRLIIQGKTFAYTATGPEGFAGGKRVIFAVSRGGFYNAESPYAANEHVETYLRSIFGFIGIQPEFVVAEGIAVSPDHRTNAIADAEKAITALAG